MTGNLSINNPYYHYPYYPHGRLGVITYTSSYAETVSEPKVINIPAYGLRHSNIKIKEIDSTLTVKTKDKIAGYHADINKTYNLKNVKLNSSNLRLGVLILEFVDTKDVINHEVKEVQ